MGDALPRVGALSCRESHRRQSLSVHTPTWREGKMTAAFDPPARAVARRLSLSRCLPPPSLSSSLSSSLSGGGCALPAPSLQGEGTVSYWLGKGLSGSRSFPSWSFAGSGI